MMTRTLHIEQRRAADTRRKVSSTDLARLKSKLMRAYYEAAEAAALPDDWPRRKIHQRAAAVGLEVATDDLRAVSPTSERIIRATMTGSAT